MATKTKENEASAARFTKEQLASSIVFADRKDAVDAVLKDGGTYTIEEAKTAIKNYMEGVVG